jgi:hypothetical protein
MEHLSHVSQLSNSQLVTLQGFLDLYSVVMTYVLEYL